MKTAKISGTIQNSDNINAQTCGAGNGTCYVNCGSQKCQKQNAVSVETILKKAYGLKTDK